MPMRTFLFLWFCCSQANLSAQQVSLRFIPGFGDSRSLESIDLLGDSLSIHTLRFYLSGFSLLKNGREIWREQDGFHLLDLADESTLSISLKTGARLDFDAVRFDLGIDSLTNVSGAMGGDLDPTKGMYWAWQSGYINLKLEGFFEKCPARHHEFQFHLGGYMPPFRALQTITLPARPDREIRVDMDLALFFEKLDLTQTHTLMSPSKEAVQLAAHFATIFHAHAP